jgi:TRAP transporter TAXI family solute receptor
VLHPIRLAVFLLASLIGLTPSRAAEPDWPDAITIATGSPGGTYYVYGEGLAKILSRSLGIRVAMRPTDGPSENIELIESGKADIGFVTMGVAQQAWNGTGAWTGRAKLQTMRAMFPMYDTLFHFIALRNSEIHSIADLAGKRLGVGPDGGTSATYTPPMLAALNLEATLRFGTWEELTAGLEQGALEGLVVAAGVPFPAVSGLEARNAVRYLPLTPDEMLALRLAIPELNASVIPAGTYPSLMYGYDTVGLYNFAVARKDLAASLVYEVVKAVFEHHEEMMEVHPAAASTVPKNFVHNTFLPYHDGATRYYGNAVSPGVLIGD